MAAPVRRGHGSLQVSSVCSLGEASRKTGALSFPPQNRGKPSSFTPSQTSLQQHYGWYSNVISGVAEIFNFFVICGEGLGRKMRSRKFDSSF